MDNAFIAFNLSSARRVFVILLLTTNEKIPEVNHKSSFLFFIFLSATSIFISFRTRFFYKNSTYIHVYLHIYLHIFLISQQKFPSQNKRVFCYLSVADFDLYFFSYSIFLIKTEVSMCQSYQLRIHVLMASYLHISAHYFNLFSILLYLNRENI